MVLPAGKCSGDVCNCDERPPNDPNVQRSSPSARGDDFRRLMAKLVEQVPRSCGLQRFPVNVWFFSKWRRRERLTDSSAEKKRKVRDPGRERQETLPSPSPHPPARDTGDCTNRWRVCVCVCEMTPAYRRMRPHGSRGVNSHPLIHGAFLFLLNSVLLQQQ